MEHYRRQEFAAAVADFEQALREKPHPAVLFNLGRAHAAAGNFADAFHTLERFLRECGDSITPRRREEVEQLLLAQRAHLGAIEIQSTDPEVTISIDSAVVGMTPAAASFVVMPGRHSVVGTKTGLVPMVFAVDVEQQKTILVVLQGHPLPVVAAVVEQPTYSHPRVGPRAASAFEGSKVPAVQSPARPMRTAGLAAIGVGAAAAGLGAYFALRAASSWNERQRHCPNSVCDEAAVHQRQDARSEARAADVSFALSVLGAGLGSYLLLRDSAAPRHDEKAHTRHVERGPWQIFLEHEPSLVSGAP